MTTTKTNKILVGAVIVLLFFVSLQTCNRRTNTEPITTVVTTVDTTHVSYVDTIPFYNIIDSIRWTNLPVIAQSINEDSTEYTYTTAMQDSLIDGTISTSVRNDGTLVNQDFTYIPKFPKYIRTFDTTWINKETTITNTIQEDDWGIYVGVMVSPYKNLSMIGTAGIKTKKDMYFGIGYEPFQQNIYLDFKIQLKRNK